MVIILWLIFSLLVGVIGSKRNIGFLFSFILSLLLSPIIGLIFTLLSKSETELMIQNKFIKDKTVEQFNQPLPDGWSNAYLKDFVPESEMLNGSRMRRYFVKNGQTVKAGSKIIQIQVNGETVTITAPNKMKIGLYNPAVPNRSLSDPLFKYYDL